MNILHISTDYSRGTLVYKTLIDELEHYCSNRVFVPKRSGTEKYISYISSEVPCFSQFDRGIYFSKQKKIVSAIKTVYNIPEFDIIAAHTLFSTGYAAYKLNKEYGIPYTVSVINTDVNVFFKNIIHLRNTGINIMKNASAIIFISNTYRDYVINTYIPEGLQDEFLSKSHVIPFAIDYFYLKNKYRKKELSDDCINVLQVARDFDHNKNLKTTVKAVEFLKSCGNNINLTVVGNVERNSDKRLIDKYDFIKHIPYCEKENLIKLYRQSDIFIMPSHRETFGLVYPEAMSQGLPVIYSRGQGFDRNFPEGTIGFSVDSDNYREIAEKILDVIDNYKNISDNCIKKVELFSAEKVAEQYINVFTKVINKEHR